MIVSVIISMTFGLSCVATSMVMLAKRKRFSRWFADLSPNDPLIIVLSFLMLFFSILLIVIHNQWYNLWHGLISLIGWGLFLKSLSWLFLTEHLVDALHQCAYSEYYLLSCIIMLLTGLFYVVLGFAPVWHLT